MSTMNSIILDLLYEDELWHEEPGYSKAEKAKYNREYYQKHKQYWKDYYKTGQGIGRGPSTKPTSSASDGRQGIKEAVRMLDDATKNKYAPKKRRSIGEAAKMLDAATKDKYSLKKRRSVGEAAKMLDAATKDKQTEYENRLRKAAFDRTKKTVGGARKAVSLDVDKINKEGDLINRRNQTREAIKTLDSATKDRTENTRKKVADAGYNYLKKSAKENAKEWKRTASTLQRDAKAVEFVAKRNPLSLDPSKYTSIKESQGQSHTSKGSGLKETERKLSEAKAKLNELKRQYRDNYEMTGLTSEEKALKNRSLSSAAVLKRKIEASEKEVERLQKLEKQLAPEDSKEWATMLMGGYKTSRGGGGKKW